MKILVQRVSEAKVEVDRKTVGKIEEGVLVLLGITHKDTQAEATWLAKKLVNLRIFEDDQGKINRSLIERKGSALIISQFTLYADCNEGRRPSFTQAAAPNRAKPLYEYFVSEVKQNGINVETGEFGAEMKVFLLNDGPFTVLLER